MIKVSNRLVCILLYLSEFYILEGKKMLLMVLKGFKRVEQSGLKPNVEKHCNFHYRFDVIFR